MAVSSATTVAELADAIRSGDRSALARAITLVESTRADHRDKAQQLLLELMPDAGSAMHIGITGVPGVGKSTSIEALGMYLISDGHRVAVLAVDPSSTRTGGSILGDKTRMARLAVHADAYIRPSAGWPAPPAKPWCCWRRPVSTSSWSRPSASGNRRSRSPTWWIRSCS
jgi:LAO/AO transport system kinase